MGELDCKCCQIQALKLTRHVLVANDDALMPNRRRRHDRLDQTVQDLVKSFETPFYLC